MGSGNLFAQYIFFDRPLPLMLIYDLRKESGQTGKSETIEAEGKKIFAARV
jgi:hypothetical protein